jgi:PPE-repeat protein
MNFFVLPPEINSLRMFSGTGSAPMLEAAAAWDGLASELGSAATSFGSAISALAGQSWQGPAPAAMAADAVPYAGWLGTAAVHAAGASAQARAVASAFEAAKAATIHPVLVAADRNALVRLLMSNLFGQNAPAIAAADFDYERMWAHDVAALVGYHSEASAAAAALPSWQQALQRLTKPAAAAAGLGSIVGNLGALDLGGGNQGNVNLGSGNSGNANVGGGNLGNGNLGSGNHGPTNVGFGNTGAFNRVAGNVGKRELRLR